MKSVRSIQIIILVGVLTTIATASDDSLFPTQAKADQDSSQSPTTQSDESTNKPSLLDRRDRIFYPGDTERPKPLFRKLFLNIALDQKEIFTSPFHVNRH